MMIFQSKQHKAEFVDYINFKIEMCDKDFLKKNKLIRGIGNLFSWNLLMLNFIVLLCMFAFFGLVVNAFSTFLIEIKNPFSVVYIISLLLSFGCVLLFSRVSKKDLFVYNSFKFKKLNDNDFIELKHYFTDSYIDELLVEYCERKNTESPLNWKLLIELFEHVKKEIIQDSEIQMIKQKIYDNNEGKNMLIQTDTQKIDFINYMNFRIKQVKEQFYRDNKIAYFLGSLIKWDFKIAERICWFLMALLPFIFISSVFLKSVSMWYLVPFVAIIFFMSSIFSNINDIEEKPVILLIYMPLTEQDLAELKYFFNESFMDKVLKEFCEKKGEMSWCRFTLILNLLNEEIKENNFKTQKETDVKNFQELKNRIFNRG